MLGLEGIPVKLEISFLAISQILTSIKEIPERKNILFRVGKTHFEFTISKIVWTFSPKYQIEYGIFYCGFRHSNLAGLVTFDTWGRLPIWILEWLLG